MIEKWCDQDGKALWVKVKHIESRAYILNDMFPLPPNEKNEVCIFFDIARKDVYSASNRPYIPF